MIETQKHLFELDDTITYLNGAYMSPLLKKVATLGKQQVSLKLRPYTVVSNDFFSDVEAIKIAFAKLTNTNTPNRIAIIPSTSYGLANIANNVNLKGKEILILADQFPSNVYPWVTLEKRQSAKIKTIDRPPNFSNRGKQWNENILKAINSNTGLVAIPHVHWADGTLFDIKKIRKKTKEVGALLIIDGTQSVGAYPFDIGELSPDALICSGYKWLMGPYGIGLAYYGEAFDNGTPIEQNWINRKGSENFSNLINYENEYKSVGARFSVGEHSNFILLPMLLESIKQINLWGVDSVQNYCESITQKPLEILQEHGYFVENLPYRASHLMSISKKDLNIEKIKKKLEDNHIFVSSRGSSVRLSSHVYNTEKELFRFVDAMIN